MLNDNENIAYIYKTIKLVITTTINNIDNDYY